MNTVIYFIRHSKPLKVKSLNYNEHVQLQNEKSILSVEGEERAKRLSELDELASVDLVVSSNYVRAVATAKYIADKNNLDIYIEEDFRERKQGINSWDELPVDFELMQLKDENYKIGNGESQVEVRERTYTALIKLLSNNRGKRIAIVFHATAISFLLKKWCDVYFAESIGKMKMSFNNRTFFEGPFDAPEMFKTVFNDKNQIISIENIRGWK